MLSALLSPYKNLPILWNYMEGFYPPLLTIRFFMKKYIDNLEVVALMGIFISSLIAITPIS